MRAHRIAFVALCVWAMLAAGCSRGQSTRLTIGDLNYIVTEMDAKLAASDWLRERTAASPVIRVTINKVQNLTSDVITPSEQWMLMARVRDRLARSRTLREKHVIFQLAPEEHDPVREAGFKGDLGPTDPPTHVMSAVFRSATRAGIDKQANVDRRLDYYYIDYRVVDVTNNEVKWNDAVEFKREAIGLTID